MPPVCHYDFDVRGLGLGLGLGLRSGLGLGLWGVGVYCRRYSASRLAEENLFVQAKRLSSQGHVLCSHEYALSARLC